MCIGGYKGSHEDDVESGGGAEPMDFESDFVRRNFIKKVYLILGTQLLVTLGLVAAMVTSDLFYEFIELNPILFLVAIGVVFITLIMLMCCPDLRRTSPLNYIFLAIFTLAESFLLGVISTRYNTQVVLMALGLTVIICLALSLYAFQTKVDFTAIGGVLLVLLILLMVFGIVLMFFRTNFMVMVYCSLGVLLYSIFLIVDTQMMMGGDHAYTIRPDEYVFAALNLYIDIIQIFIFLLQILGNES